MKNYLKLGIFLFGISLTLINCKDEDFFNEKQNNKNNISIKYVNKKFINSNKTLLKSLDKIKTKKVTNIFKKNVTDSVTGIEIDTDYAKYIETDNGRHSYTFYVTNTPENNGLQNIILHLQDDGSYQTSLINYDLTQQEIENLGTNLEIDLTNRVSLEILENSNFSTNVFGKLYADDCVSEVMLPCDNGDTYSHGPEEYEGGGYCTGSYAYLEVNDACGGGNDGGTSDNYNNGGNGLPGPTPTPTSPTPCRDCFIGENNDPCDELNDLTDPNKANIKSKLQNLKNESATNSGESGFQMEKDSSGNYTNPDVLPSTTNQINFGRGGDTYAAAHSHPFSSTFPLFSWADVFILYQFYKYADPSVKQEVTFIVASSVSPAPAEIYAIKIDSYTDFEIQIGLDFQNIIASNPANLTGVVQKFKIKALDKKLAKEYRKDLNSEKVFLEYFGNHNISLYKANSTLDNWSELTLDPTFGTVIETPCN